MDWAEVRKRQETNNILTDLIFFYLLSAWQLDSKHKLSNGANTVSKKERASDVI